MPRAVWVAAPALVGGLLLGSALGWLAHGDKRDRTIAVTQPSLIPAGTEATDIRVLHGTSQIAVAWQRNADGSPAEFGLTIWQRRNRGPGWDSIYTRRISTINGSNIHDLRLKAVDLTLDNRDDLFVYEDHDGSGGCFVYRVLTTKPGQARQIAARSTCSDQTTVLTQPGELISYDGVGKDPKTSFGIHCCPLYWRHTVRKWNGKRFVVVSSSRSKTRPVSSQP